MAVTTQELFKSFNPNEHIMQIEHGEKKKKSDYLPVQWRLVWFRALCPEGTIDTTMLHLDLEMEFDGEKWIWDAGLRKNVRVPTTGKGIAIFHAVVTDGKGGSASGTKSEKSVDFSDFIEKAETGAIGRALAALGYGTQFTGDELNEGDRIADSPVDNGKTVESGNGQQPAPPKQAQQPRQLPTPDPTIKAANDGLRKAASVAKQRALENGLDWEKLLQECGIASFDVGPDIGKVNRIIDTLIEASSKVAS